MIIRALLLTLAVAVSGLAGCSNIKSQVPLSDTYEYSKQQKMQAAHHWDVLAEDVATRLSSHLEDSPAVRQPISIKSDGGSPFNQAFRELLISQMVNQGFDIRDNADIPIQLTFDTQVISHSDRGYVRPPKGTFTALSLIANGIWAAVSLANNSNTLQDALIVGSSIGTGVALDATVGNISRISNKEVIINVSLKENERYLMRKTGIYYINEADHYHYDDTSKALEVVSE